MSTRSRYWRTRMELILRKIVRFVLVPWSPSFDPQQQAGKIINRYYHKKKAISQNPGMDNGHPLPYFLSRLNRTRPTSKGRCIARFQRDVSKYIAFALTRRTDGEGIKRRNLSSIPSRGLGYALWRHIFMEDLLGAFIPRSKNPANPYTLRDYQQSHGWGKLVGAPSFYRCLVHRCCRYHPC